MNRHWILLVGIVHGLAAPFSVTDADAAARSGDLRLRVIDEATEAPLPCRVHLKNARGVARKAPGLPFLHDHFVCDGTLELTLREGNYTFEIECGPEYHTRGGHFAINRFSDEQHVVPMRRITDMAAEGWWSGDLYVRRRLADVPLLMQAEDLHVAEVVSWAHHKTYLPSGALPRPLLTQFDTNRYHRVLAGRDDRAGGGLALFQLTRERMVGIAEDALAPLSYAAIAAIGAWLALRGARRIWRARPHHDHHHHGTCDSCGHSHRPSVEDIRATQGWRDMAILVAGIAMRPCTGAVFVLLITWQMGIAGAGIAAAFAMAAGTALVTVLVALAAAGLRGGMLTGLAGSETARRAGALIEVSAGLAIGTLALAMLL